MYHIAPAIISFHNHLILVCPWMKPTICVFIMISSNSGLLSTNDYRLWIQMGFHLQPKRGNKSVKLYLFIISFRSKMIPPTGSSPSLQYDKDLQALSSGHYFTEIFSLSECACLQRKKSLTRSKEKKMQPHSGRLSTISKAVCAFVRGQRLQGVDRAYNSKRPRFIKHLV